MKNKTQTIRRIVGFLNNVETDGGFLAAELFDPVEMVHKHLFVGSRTEHLSLVQIQAFARPSSGKFLGKAAMYCAKMLGGVRSGRP